MKVQVFSWRRTILQIHVLNHVRPSWGLMQMLRSAPWQNWKNPSILQNTPSVLFKIRQLTSTPWSPIWIRWFTLVQFNVCIKRHHKLKSRYNAIRHAISELLIKLWCLGEKPPDIGMISMFSFHDFFLPRLNVALTKIRL